MRGRGKGLKGPAEGGKGGKGEFRGKLTKLQNGGEKIRGKSVGARVPAGIKWTNRVSFVREKGSVDKLRGQRKY